MNQKTQREPEIFEAAYQLLTEKGYKATSMLAIARKANASNETLYNWYRNKQGLLAAMIEENANLVTTSMEQFFADTSELKNPIAALEMFGRLLLKMLTGERAIALNRAAAADAAYGAVLGQLLNIHGRAQVMPYVEKIIASAQEKNLLRNENVGEIAEIYIALLIGDLQIRRVNGVIDAPAQEAIERHSQRVIELLTGLFGLQAARNPD